MSEKSLFRYDLNCSSVCTWPDMVDMVHVTRPALGLLPSESRPAQNEVDHTGGPADGIS